MFRALFQRSKCPVGNTAVLCESRLKASTQLGPDVEIGAEEVTQYRAFRGEICNLLGLSVHPSHLSIYLSLLYTGKSHERAADFSSS